MIFFMVTFATFNVNSVNIRVDAVKFILERDRPDYVFLQELKCVEEKFPAAAFEEFGYYCYVLGQKAYNGVAILSKKPLKGIFTKLMPDDTAARYIEGVTEEGMIVASVYVPNGNPVGTEKLSYKLKFMEELSSRIERLLDQGKDFVIGGDYNVIYEEQDAYNPKAFEGDALYHPEVRKMFRSYMNLGAKTALRVIRPEDTVYTWYSYRAGSFQRGNGILIDHFLINPGLSDRVMSVVTDDATRQTERPSDHVPLIMKIK